MYIHTYKHICTCMQGISKVSGTCSRWPWSLRTSPVSSSTYISQPWRGRYRAHVYARMCMHLHMYDLYVYMHVCHAHAPRVCAYFLAPIHTHTHVFSHLLYTHILVIAELFEYSFFMYAWMDAYLVVCDSHAYEQTVDQNVIIYMGTWVHMRMGVYVYLQAGIWQGSIGLYLSNHRLCVHVMMTNGKSVR